MWHDFITSETEQYRVLYILLLSLEEQDNIKEIIDHQTSVCKQWVLWRTNGFLLSKNNAFNKWVK